MSTRPHTFAYGEYYHVYNRGNSKQSIYLEDRDHLRFQQLLFLANGPSPVQTNILRSQGISPYSIEQDFCYVAIGAYCLMPNHFHILLTPLADDGVSLFMQKLSTGYSMYFNQKYQRAGSLFEGKFKSQHANDDVYLKYLFAYIHMNPLKLIDPKWRENGISDQKNAREYLEQYPFSSLMDHLEQDRPEKHILNKDAFPQYFNSAASVRDDMYSWFSPRKDLGE